MIPPPGISLLTLKDQGTFRGGGMDVNNHRFAYRRNKYLVSCLECSPRFKSFFSEQKYQLYIYLDRFLKCITTAEVGYAHTGVFDFDLVSKLKTNKHCSFRYQIISRQKTLIILKIMMNINVNLGEKEMSIPRC